MTTKWEIIDPDGIARFAPTSRAAACRIARRMSSTKGGRWMARELGSEATISAGHQFRFTYETGETVDRGRVDKFLGKLAVWANGALKNGGMR